MQVQSIDRSIDQSIKMTIDKSISQQFTKYLKQNANKQPTLLLIKKKTLFFS